MKNKTVSIRVDIPEKAHYGLKIKAAQAKEQFRKWIVSLLIKASE